MGDPQYPNQKQIQQLQKAAELPAPETIRIDQDEFVVRLPTYGLAVIELK
jgi:hypothetical protein